jgi:hypothetical protein
VQYAAQGKSRRGGACHQTGRGLDLGDVTEDHLDLGTAVPKALNGLQSIGFRADRPLRTIRPQRQQRHLLGQEQPESAQTAGDDVRTVVPECR